MKRDFEKKLSCYDIVLLGLVTMELIQLLKDNPKAELRHSEVWDKLPQTHIAGHYQITYEWCNHPNDSSWRYRVCGEFFNKRTKLHMVTAYCACLYFYNMEQLERSIG